MKIIATAAPFGISMPFPDLSSEIEISPDDVAIGQWRIGKVVTVVTALAQAIGYDITDENFHVIIQFR